MLRRLLTRLGYVALGAVYVALGGLAIHVAVVGARDRVRGFSAAFRYLLAHPWGPHVLTAIAAGLAAFTFARMLDAVDRRLSPFARAVALADAIGHAALGSMAVRLLLRVRRGFDSRSALGWILAQPWGANALKAAGVVVMAIGAFQIWQGVSGRLRLRRARRALGAATDTAIRVGRFGYVVRGIVTAIIAWFLLRAADAMDPARYHGIGGALEVLERMRFGAGFLGLAGVGLVAYGGYLALLGFFRRKV
jgi:hypothetical protein